MNSYEMEQAVKQYEKQMRRQAEQSRQARKH